MTIDPPTGGGSEGPRSAGRRSVRSRLVWAFGISSFVLSVSFALLILGTATLSEDLLVANVLRLEIDDFLVRRSADPEAPLPSNRWFEATFDRASLPEVLHPLSDSRDGVHELENIFPANASVPEYHLAIRTLDDGRRLYMYLDASQVEVIDQYFGLVAWTLLAGIAVVTLLGITLGHATARRVIRPLIELSERLGASDPAEPVSLSHDLADDEVGLLARALEDSMDRSRAFLDRERRFTRDASHELRTPVTVVRGAVELLDALPEAQAPTLRRPIERIQRANDAMARLIEAFLWLAREEALAEGAAPRRLADEVREAIERHRHLLADKDVTLDLDVPGDFEVEAPEGVLGIVLGNLVANAFHFTQEGRVRIGAQGRGLEISDTGPGLSADHLDTLRRAHQRGERSQGFGLGLAIVGDLCERFGWRFEIDSRPDEGLRARLEFP